MSNKDHFERLHDRATRKEDLTNDEWTQLNEWYANQDIDEQRELAVKIAPDRDTLLQTRINVVLAQLLATAQRIQELSQENEDLRREVSDLQRQLATILTSRAA